MTRWPFERSRNERIKEEKEHFELERLLLNVHPHFCDSEGAGACCS